jgi:hypothetical protein
MLCRNRFAFFIDRIKKVGINRLRVWTAHYWWAFQYSFMSINGTIFQFNINTIRSWLVTTAGLNVICLQQSHVDASRTYRHPPKCVIREIWWSRLTSSDNKRARCGSFFSIFMYFLYLDPLASPHVIGIHAIDERSADQRNNRVRYMHTTAWRRHVWPAHSECEHAHHRSLLVLPARFGRYTGTVTSSYDKSYVSRHENANDRI